MAISLRSGPCARGGRAVRRRALHGLALVAWVLAAGCGRGPRETSEAGPAASTGAERSGTDGRPAAGSLSPGEGRLTCDAPRFDFGKVREGALLEHAFRVQVAPGEAVVVRAARGDCGCTTPTLRRLPGGDARRALDYALDEPLAPGDALEVRVRYDTRGHPGGTTRALHLYANVPTGRFELQVQADVDALLVATPDPLLLGWMGESETKTAQLEVQSRDGSAFELHHERSAVPDALTLALERKAPDRWGVALTLGPGMPEGPHQYPLYLVSDLPADPRAKDGDAAERRVSVTPQLVVEVLGRFRLDPPLFDFGRIGEHATVARSLRLTAHEPGFVLETPYARLEPIDAGAPFPLGETARVDVRPAPDGDGFDVQVLIQGLSPAVENRFLARVVLTTGHPDQPELEAQLIGERAEPRAPARPEGAHPAAPPPVPGDSVPPPVPGEAEGSACAGTGDAFPPRRDEAAIDSSNRTSRGLAEAADGAPGPIPLPDRGRASSSARPAG